MTSFSLTETVTNSNLAMTSREIAEMAGKQHKHVLRDIDNLLKSLSPELGAGFSMTYEGDPANGYRYYVMDRDSTYCLVAGYDANTRMKIIKRWQELEVKQPAELTREQILVMALESERERMRLAQVIEEQRPMVEFHDEVSKTADEMTIAETCSVLFNGSVMEKTLRSWLKTNHWLDQRPGMRKPTKWAMQRGYMRVRECPGNNGKMYPTPVVCAPGITTLRHLYRTGELFVAAIPKVQRIQLVARMV